MNRISRKAQLALWEEHRVSAIKKRGRKQCLICGYWIHKDMLDCQPCIGAKPVYSMLHKFDSTKK